MTKKCGFCSRPISGNRAKEHVFRNSWLKRLGHSKSPIPLDLHSGSVLIQQRDLVADQVQAGAICKHCNNGWMNDFDLAVESTVLSLAQSGDVDDTEGLSAALSRWIFKTAFAFTLIDKPSRRHVPFALMDGLRAGELPKSYITYFHRALFEKHVGASSLDVWPSDGADFEKSSQSDRFKFGIQYDNVVFGCAYVNWDNAEFILTPGLHQIIELNGASYRYTQFDEFQLPAGMANTRVNYTVAALGVGKSTSPNNG